MMHVARPPAPERQHAPVRTPPQLFEEHVVPLPWYVPPARWQCAGVAVPHAPVGRQHAPVATWPQFAVVHAVFTPWNDPPTLAHCDDVVTWQPPLTRQHAPSCAGQLMPITPQAVPLPW